MKSIKEIFEKSLYRIPDYQRGYSWKEIHLDDLWQDIQNLQKDKIHYTGPITLEKVPKANLTKWTDDQWLLKTNKYIPYYIIDGQQRLTTLVILLAVLIEEMGDMDSYLSQSKQQLLAQYIYASNSKNNIFSYYFGYEIDDPSYEYLKKEIFKQHSSKSNNQPETSYTNNLGFAYKFFVKKILELDKASKEIVFKKITTQLVFDVKEIEEDLDIFVVFETLNNRGKSLTNLEKLKNRLIYLSTIIPISNKNEKTAIRNDINSIWKSCYEYLGKNKKNQLDDDDFLRNHFILYFYFQKEKGFPYVNLFKEIFTVQNAVSKKPSVSFITISAYIKSLQKASEQWYIIKNPVNAYNNSLISEEESNWLKRINRLRVSVFYPLILAVYLKDSEERNKVSLLKHIESFCFLNYYCIGKRTSYGNTVFPKLASEYYKGELTLKDILETINDWTFGDEGAFTVEKFVLNVKDYFTGSKKSGYYDWPGSRYLLFEYDDFLRKKEDSKVQWSKPNSIEHIYPQTDSDLYWKKNFKGYTTQQKKYLLNSIGNLLLLSTSKNSELSNRDYPYKRQHEYKSGNLGGYVMGSHSENQLAYKYQNWTPRNIYLRGKEIIEFISKRWNIEIKPKEAKKLLLIDEKLMKRIR